MAFVLSAVIIFVRSLDAAEVLISDVPAYLQNNFTGANDCGPVASAMVLGYWDSFGYDKLVDGGDGSSSYTTNPGGVTALVNDLKAAQGWDPVEGTDIVGRRDGIKAVANNPEYGNEYDFNTGNVIYDFDTWVKTEIDAGRPLLLTTYNHPIYHDHIVTVVGYDDTNSRLIIHDNWDDELEYLNWSEPPDWTIDGSTLTIVWPGPPGEPIPEPTTLCLVGFGLLGVLGIVIRQRRKEK